PTAGCSGPIPARLAGSRRGARTSAGCSTATPPPGSGFRASSSSGRRGSSPRASKCWRPRGCAPRPRKRKTIPANELYAVALNVPAAEGLFTYRIGTGLGGPDAGRGVRVQPGGRAGALRRLVRKAASGAKLSRAGLADLSRRGLVTLTREEVPSRVAPQLVATAQALPGASPEAVSRAPRQAEVLAWLLARGAPV